MKVTNIVGYCKLGVGFKGNSADLTHQSVFTGVGEHYCICETRCTV